MLRKTTIQLGAITLSLAVSIGSAEAKDLGDVLLQKGVITVHQLG